MDSNYIKRKLWSSLTKIGIDENFAYEAVYAYSMNYPGALTSTPGRYRIRISRMPAAEFLKNFSEEIQLDQADPRDLNITFTIQAFLEKWSAEGWMPCLDWMGNPDSTEAQIEDDLNEMFESFTTGVPRDSVEEEYTPIPRRPPKKTRAKKVPSQKPKPFKKGDESDFDWV